MKTKEQMIAQLKKDYTSIRVGSDLIGYTELTAEEYEATILEWADVELAREASLEAEANAEAEAEANATARTEILDRLGLTADEAAILLG
jgi:hypothetical protein